MKNGILISLLFLTNLAIAGEVPDCWDRPNEIQDGVFLINFSAEEVTKKQLIEILDRANGRHLQPRQYPLVMDDFILIVVEAVDYGVGEYRLSREELKFQVRKELTPIAQINGVTITCNNIIRPWPRPDDRRRPRSPEQPDHFRWDNGEDKGWRR